jgi:uncharacterized protein (TIGR02284 family)
MVGTQQELAKTLNALIELDLDAVGAYRAALDKLHNDEDKANFARFMNDHQRHVADLQPLVEAMGEKAATDTDAKAVLVKGKVVLAGIFGDRMILEAMKTNEDDTNLVYERASARTDLTAEMMTVINRNLGDERRHRAYIVRRLDQIKGARASASASK